MNALSRRDAAECQLADQLRLCEIADIEDNAAAVAVGKIGALAFNMGRAVKGKFQPLGIGASLLFRQREAADLAWITRIADVDAAIDFPA